MKFAVVAISLSAALGAVQASPSQAAASLGLIQAQPQQPQQQTPRATQLAVNTVQTAPVDDVSLIGNALPANSAPEVEAPGSAAETTLVMLATGLIALLAVARRRTPR